MKGDKTGHSEASEQPHDASADPAIGNLAQDEARTKLEASGTNEDEEDATVPPMSHDMQRFIGKQLRAVYDDVAKQPVPDRFLELMKQLDNKTSAG